VAPQKALEVINTSSGRSLQSEVRIPEEVISRKFDYGFKFSLMHKDVRIAENIVCEKFPGATLLPAAKKTMDACNQWFESNNRSGENVDYTRISEYLEHMAHAKLDTSSVSPKKAAKM